MSIKEKDIIQSMKRNNLYFEDFITRSIYHSNAIEGNALSYYETYQLIFQKDSSEKITATARELYEAINLKYAMDYIFRNITKEISKKFICDIAIQINKNINEISGLRTVPVFIQGAEYVPPAAADVPGMLQELLYTSFRTNDFCGLSYSF